MPELPEVESMRRYLTKKIVGKTIQNLIVYNPNSISIDAPFINMSIVELTRIGKKLFIHLSNNVIISVHFKMSGSFYIRGIEEERDTHDRVIFELDSCLLCFHDPRKFGKIIITRYKTVAYKHVGIDALSDQLDSPYLYTILHKHAIGIKRFLLDQTYISGIGNIYVDEILFISRIHPNKLSNTITKKMSEILVMHMKQILTLSIEKGGSSLGTGESNYQVQGKRGEYQRYFQVFGKTGSPCPRCSTLIEKIKVGGRSTHICPSCQVM